MGAKQTRSGAGLSPRRFFSYRGGLGLDLLALGSMVVSIVSASATIAAAAPFVPADATFVLEHVPSARDPASRTLREKTTQLARTPRDVALAETVARLDIQEARKRGDPRFLGRAEAALAPWPLTTDAPAAVLLLRATILQSNHDFDGSLAALGRVLKADSRSGQAWLTLAAVHQARAEYPAALQACGQIAAMVLGIVPAVCTASIMSLNGRAPLALRVITLTLSQDADEARANPTVAAWAATAAAETAERLGDPSTERRYREALAIDGTDPYLLGAWSDWLLDHDRPREVIALLGDRTRVDPLLLRLALAEQATGDGRLAGHIADLAARFEASRLRGDTVHRREEARFALHLEHEPARALTLARANWAVQREPADARILFEAANAAGQPQAADPARAWLRDNGVEDARLSTLAGMSSNTAPAGSTPAGSTQAGSAPAGTTTPAGSTQTRLSPGAR